MSVSSLFSNAVSAADPLTALSASSTPASGSGSASALTSAASATSLSGQATLLSQLQQLSLSDPSAFKKETSDIAAQLQTEAQQASGGQGRALSSLAGKFEQASQTGSLSALTPAHAHHGGHHHGGAAASAIAAYAQSTATPDAASVFSPAAA